MTIYDILSDITRIQWLGQFNCIVYTLLIFSHLKSRKGTNVSVLCFIMCSEIQNMTYKTRSIIKKIIVEVNRVLRSLKKDAFFKERQRKSQGVQMT